MLGHFLENDFRGKVQLIRNDTPRPMVQDGIKSRPGKSQGASQ